MKTLTLIFITVVMICSGKANAQSKLKGTPDAGTKRTVIVNNNPQKKPVLKKSQINENEIKKKVILNNTDLKGKWQVDANRTIHAINGVGKEKYNQFHESARNNIDQAIATRTYFFTDTQVIIDYSVNKGPRHVEGTWSYEKHSQVLTLTVGQRSKEFTVERENNNAIRLIDKNASVKSMVKELYLIRKN